MPLLFMLLIFPYFPYFRFLISDTETIRAGKNLDDSISNLNQSYKEGNDYFKVKKTKNKSKSKNKNENKNKNTNKNKDHDKNKNDLKESGIKIAKKRDTEKDKKDEK